MSLIDNIKTYWLWLIEHWRKGLKYLFGASILVQVIAILAYFIFPFFYPKISFVHILVFSTLAGLIGLNANGRFYLGIMVAKNEREAWQIVLFSSTLALLIAALFGVIITQSSSYFGDIFSICIFSIPIWFFAVTYIFTVAMSMTLENWLNRQQAYRQLSHTRTLKSLLNVGLGCVFGILQQIEGMILALTISQLCTFFLQLYFSVQFLKPHNIAFFQVKLGNFWQLLKKHYQTPLFSLLASIIVTICWNQEILLTKTYFGENILTDYSFADRFLRIPSAVIVASLGDYFFRLGAKLYNDTEGGKKKFWLQVRSLVRLCSMVSVVWVLPLAVGAGWFVPFFFGEKWAIAGQIIQILVFQMGVISVMASLTNFGAILQKQYWQLLWEGSIYIGALLLYFACIYWNLTFFIAFSIKTIFVTLGYILYIFWLLKKIKSLQT